MSKLRADQYPYESSYAFDAKQLVMGGASIREVAEFFDVPPNVIFYWCKRHLKFGKAYAEAYACAKERVVNALYERAIGYEHKATKILATKRGIETVEYTEHIAPDIGAIKFWLTNRNGNEWSDKTSVEHSGAVNLGSALDALQDDDK